MKDEIKEILDELKAIVETKDYENGLVYIEHSYLKVIHYYITNLQEENKMYAQLKEEYEDIIDKAVEYIENDLKSFLYSIEYKTLLNILNGGDE